MLKFYILRVCAHTSIRPYYPKTNSFGFENTITEEHPPGQHKKPSRPQMSHCGLPPGTVGALQKVEGAAHDSPIATPATSGSISPDVSVRSTQKHIFQVHKACFRP